MAFSTSVLCILLCKLFMVLSIPKWSKVYTRSVRIMNGRDANINEFPFVVQLEWHCKVFENDSISLVVPTCTGASVSPTWTITAAHCIRDSKYTLSQLDNTTLKVRYGYPRGKPSPEDKLSSVLKYVAPPLKGSPLISYEDIALLRTDPISVSRYARLSVVDYTSLYGQEVVLVGFGRANDGEIIYSAFYLGKPLQVIDRAVIKRCDENNIYPSICVAPMCGQTSVPCPGDSGAPVLHPSGVVGLLSRVSTESCYLKDATLRSLNTLAITPLSPFMDWISDVIGGKFDSTDSNKTMDNGMIFDRKLFVNGPHNKLSLSDPTTYVEVIKRNIKL